MAKVTSFIPIISYCQRLGKVVSVKHLKFRVKSMGSNSLSKRQKMHTMEIVIDSKSSKRYSNLLKLQTRAKEIYHQNALILANFVLSVTRLGRREVSST